MKKTLYTLLLALGTASMLGCSTDEAEPAAPGKITFQIEGEDIPYDSLTGEDGYNHVKYATIEYAYMIIKTPKLDPHNKPAAKTAAGTAIQHTGTPLNGIFAVDLLKENVLGTVDAEAGDFGTGSPSLSIYNPTEAERATLTDKDGALANIPAGHSFRFGGMLYPKAGGSYRYEIRENLTALVNILEHPPEAGAGDPLVVKPNQTLVAEFHPHIDHALEVICQDRLIDFSTLAKSGDTLVFSPTLNNSVGGTDIYSLITGHINRGDHWDVNVIPE